MAIDLTQRMAHGLPSVLEVEGAGQTFALLVRGYRKQQGWTQEELAEEWNYSFETISAWERGKRFPGRPELFRLADLLGMDPEGLGHVVAQSKGKQAERGQRVQSPSVPVVSAAPFERGRLFWTLHLGVEHGRLQCLITCPLASGEMWKVPLDSITDAEVIRLVHQMVHEQIGKVAGMSAVQAGGNA